MTLRFLVSIATTIVVLTLLGILSELQDGASVVPTSETASSTLATVPNESGTSSMPDISEPPEAIGINPPVQTPPKTEEKPKSTPKKPPAEIPVSAPIAIQPVSEPPTEITYDATTQKVRAALVNIICYTHDSSLKPISGTGVVIDPRGIILTVAHVGQYFLLRDYPRKDDVTCIIRTGSPAKDAYEARPVYVSESWITKNPATLTVEEPSGTGENDFALLAITKSATLTSLPSSYPFVTLSSDTPTDGEPVVIGSYGAQFLSGDQILSSLYPTLVFGSVKGVYTFVASTVDLISLGGSVAAQEGSSGGIVTDADGAAIGLITTSTIKGDTASRELRAITPRHIRASYLVDTGNDFDSYFATHDFPTLINAFSDTFAKLKGILILNLNR